MHSVTHVTREHMQQFLLKEPWRAPSHLLLLPLLAHVAYDPGPATGTNGSGAQQGRLYHRFQVLAPPPLGRPHLGGRSAIVHEMALFEQAHGLLETVSPEKHVPPRPQDGAEVGSHSGPTINTMLQAALLANV